MNASTRMKLLGVVAGVAAAVGMAVPAQALSNYGDVRASWLGDNVNGRPVVGTGIAASGGVFRFSRDNADSLDTFTGTLVDNKNIILNGNTLNTFIGVCLEVGEYVNQAESTFTIRDLADAPLDSPGAMGANRARDVAKLVTLAFNGSLSNALTYGQATVTAFQIALWEISVDRSATYNLGIGSIQSSNATALGWLTTLNNQNNTVALARNVFALTSDRNQNSRQDMLVQTPIPAAAWLLGSGLLGLFGIARRRRTVAA